MKKKIFIATIIIALLAVSAFAITTLNKSAIDRTDSSGKSKEITSDNKEVKEAEQNDLVIESNSTKPNDASIVLTGVSTSNQGYEFGSIIEGAKSGTCTLTLSMEGQQPLTRTAQITDQVDYKVCKGFTVAGQDFPSSGTWTAVLTLDVDNSQKTSNSITFEVAL